MTHENSRKTMQNTQFANEWLTKDVKRNRIGSKAQVIDGFL
jgi:hypothetical protein